MDDIASDLGISKKTIYKYFISKKSLIGAVVD
ncbi:TetR/AcrR family transcriptional regulator [Pelotomaculum isophthalicicum JI]|uniref:TetR/AcrR family transcriptional regulator n=1 Tax=Pelotomaculum isophthalicicum JI TaxID=947010 RepID=A0A9X4H1W2_9FIRM|nr:TetR/AcrR family transcriptional regulator [Pelotomaculum isophthalicicum JI]